MMQSGRYHAAVTTGDVWICYPWEARYVYTPKIPSRLTNYHFYRDIDEHDALAKEHPLVR
jgi:hypothetical protein